MGGIWVSSCDICWSSEIMDVDPLDEEEEEEDDLPEPDDSWVDWKKSFFSAFKHCTANLYRLVNSVVLNLGSSAATQALYPFHEKKWAFPALSAICCALRSSFENSWKSDGALSSSVSGTYEKNIVSINVKEWMGSFLQKIDLSLIITWVKFWYFLHINVFWIYTTNVNLNTPQFPWTPQPFLNFGGALAVLRRSTRWVLC